MKIELVKIPYENKSVLARLMQLYLHDFSEYVFFDVDSNGLYNYKYFDSYWEEVNRHPFIIEVSNQIAGFVLINSFACLPSNIDARSIAEFFVMRKYRRKGVGKSASIMTFNMFPGKWEIRQQYLNLPSISFWRKVIGEYTSEDYSEVISDDTTWKGPIQSFDNSHLI